MKVYKRSTDRMIVEMAKAMGDFELKDTVKCDIELSEHLFAKGYRKQSDIVREFVERLKQIRLNRIRIGEYDGIDLWLDVKKLANEYGVEVEE